MLAVIRQLNQLGTLQDQCMELGRFLGLTHGVAPAVFRRAQNDNRYALHLIRSRQSPDLLKMHLNDPRNHPYRRQQDAKVFSNLDLIKKAAVSMINWSRKGFVAIDDQIVKKRLDRCRHCSQLVDPPDRLIYKVKLKQHAEPRVCGLCGCVAARKIKIATESCPIGIWDAVA
jgi:hypothetical protein